VQPGIETTVGLVTVGAWGSWALNGAENSNECDLYASATVGPVGITVTDYYFPVYAGTDSLLNLDKHIIEVSGGIDVGPVSVLAEGGFAPVSLGVSANRDNLSVSYIINPDQATSFLVLGISL